MSEKEDKVISLIKKRHIKLVEFTLKNENGWICLSIFREYKLFVWITLYFKTKHISWASMMIPCFD